MALRIRIAESISELPETIAAELERTLETLATMAELLPTSDYRWGSMRDPGTGLLTAVIRGFRAYASVDYDRDELVLVAVKRPRPLLRWRRRSERLAPAPAR